MRIVHLSTSDANGGAARAAFRVHTGLKRLGHDSSMLVYRAGSKDPAVTKYKPQPGLLPRIRRSLRARRIEADHRKYDATRPTGFELFSDDRSPTGGELLGQIASCDLINLHWVAEFVDHEHVLPHLPANVPIVWRLADMAPLTGGCHYTAGCKKFTAQCGACPQLGSSNEHDLSRQIWQRKSHALSSLAGRLHLVGTSKWIASESRRSSLLKQFPITVIPNGLDTIEFSPRDKGFSRDLWGVPRDAKVVLFIADSLENKRKGFSYVVEALSGLGTSVDKPFLVSLGNLKSKLDLPVPHLNLGRINNDRLLSIVYSLADVFVMPSLQESFGQTVTESLACGTPVVAFDGGGPTDMVRPGITGWLAKCGDANALRGAIVTALSDDAGRAEMSENARRVAVEEYSLEVQAAAYVRLYERLIAEMRQPVQQQPKPATGAAVVTN